MPAVTLNDVLEKLVSRHPLTDLVVGFHEGRIDLRDSDVAGVLQGRRFANAIRLGTRANPDIVNPWVQVDQGTVSMGGLEFSNIDLSGSRLDGLRFFGCTISNCVFDRASCCDWRMWATHVSDSTFRHADLREASMGGLLDRNQNCFRKVQFIGTDLRRSVHGSAVFVECVFDRAKLKKVDFHGDSFTRCVFRGELREVCFSDRAFNADGILPNVMEDVDFSGACLRLVEFRRLDLDRVRFPVDDQHFVVYDYPAVLEQALKQLADHDDVASRSMFAFLEVCKKWVGGNQTIGVFNRRDLRELFGDDGGARCEAMLHARSA